MAGPYQRLSNGASADTGAQAITTVVNAVEAGLEAVEAALPGKETAGAAAAAQAAAVQRANHTGTQTASTISDFNTAVRANRLDQMAAPSAPVAMGSQRITGLGAPSASTDAVTKAYADALSGTNDLPGYVRPETYGGAFDGRMFTLNCTGGNTTITAVGSGHSEGASIFVAGDVGKTVVLDKVGTAGGYHTTTVATYISATQVTLTAAPVSSGTGVYGVVGTDNSSAITSAVAATAGGATTYFRGGDRFWFTTSGGWSIGNGRKWRGDGMNSSRILTTATTGNLLTVTGYECAVEDLGFHHLNYHAGVLGGTASSVEPSSGSAIYQDGAVWGNSAYRNLGIFGFYNNLYINRGQEVVVEGSRFGGARNANLILASDNPDAGSHLVRHNMFSGYHSNTAKRTTHALYWTSGGQLMAANNWFHTGVNGFTLSLVGGAYTSNIDIHDNNFEDWSGTNGAINLYCPADSDYAYVKISNNLMASVLATSNHPIQIESAGGSSHPRYGAYGYYIVSIVGNIARLSAQKIATLDRVQNGVIAANICDGNGNSYDATNSTGLY